MIYFETEEDLVRERKAIKTFVDVFGGSSVKLDRSDIDYKVFDKEGKLISYAEVKGRIRMMRDAYPLPISMFKLNKLMDKKLNPVLIWACEDGIIYARPDALVGTVKIGGRKPRENSFTDKEMMVYYEKQRGIKYVRYSKKELQDD